MTGKKKEVLPEQISEILRHRIQYLFGPVKVKFLSRSLYIPISFLQIYIEILFYIQDVAWHLLHESLFGSVADDQKLMM